MNNTSDWGRVTRVFLAFVLVAVAARLLMVWLLPPLLDVYYYDSQAVQALLRGIDPYGLTYVGIPVWLATPGASNVFAYFPGVLLFLAPFGGVLDVRFGLVFADLLVGWSIYSAGGRRARTAALVFLLFPFTAIFSTSYPNNTLVAMAFLGLAVVMWLRGRGRTASVLLGVALASSQFMWLMFPLFLVWSFRSKKFVEPVISIAVAVTLALPFLLWNWSAFTNDTLFFEFARAPRSLLSATTFGINVNPSLSGIVATLTGANAPLAPRVLVTVCALAYAVLRSRDLPSILLNGTWFMVLTMFVLPNVISLWYLELPFQTFLMWLAATGGSGFRETSRTLKDSGKVLAPPFGEADDRT